MKSQTCIRRLHILCIFMCIVCALPLYPPQFNPLYSSTVPTGSLHCTFWTLHRTRPPHPSTVPTVPPPLYPPYPLYPLYPSTVPTPSSPFSQILRNQLCTFHNQFCTFHNQVFLYSRRGTGTGYTAVRTLVECRGYTGTVHGYSGACRGYSVQRRGCGGTV